MHSDFSRKRISIRKAVLALPLALLATDALAINGLVFYGLGAKNRAMGGAGAAAPLDTSTVLINPAGLSRIGTTADIDVHLLNARRFMDTSGTVGPEAGGIVNTSAGQQESDQEFYVTPFAGLAHKSTESRWSFGAILAGVAGEGATFDHSRIDPTLLTPPGADYDTSSFLFVIKGMPAVAYDVTDRFSVGLGLHINVAMFSADMALGQAGFPQTQGNGRLDIAYGAGAQIGMLYDINDTWSVGASLTSPQWFTDFERYEDLIPDFELPPEARVGVAYKPTKRLLIALDYKWIGWTSVDLFDRLPSEGGFGWRDQHILSTGLQYHLNDSWTARFGANYGRSPLKDNVVFANALSPVVYETHLAAGGEYGFGKKHSIAFSLVRTLPHDQTDDGSGDAFSQLGRGTRVGYNGWDLDIQWSMKF